MVEVITYSAADIFGIKVNIDILFCRRIRWVIVYNLGFRTNEVFDDRSNWMRDISAVTTKADVAVVQQIKWLASVF